jgi:hypothetical protein
MDIGFKLQRYLPISLNEMERVRLMDRIDYKYMLPRTLMPEMIDSLRDNYFIQETCGIRSFLYDTIYFDTDDYEMYLAHQNGKRNRLKIRTRQYVESNLSFLEIKSKSNKGKTSKVRIVTQSPESVVNKTDDLFIHQNSPYSSVALNAKLNSRFHRITLVNKQMTERLTIDYDLMFCDLETSENVSIPNLVVVEIKKTRNTISPVQDYMNSKRIKLNGLSKYCLGIALTNTAIKQNTFKSKIIQLNKISDIEHNVNYQKVMKAEAAF